MRTVAAVVLMCGSPEFVQSFIFTAHEMGMTNPDEYAYLLPQYDTVASSRPWTGKNVIKDAKAAFKPVLQVHRYSVWHVKVLWGCCRYFQKRWEFRCEILRNSSKGVDSESPGVRVVTQSWSRSRSLLFERDSNFGTVCII